ncbi:cytochrome P450 [Melanogaster broomeanus]|nr:cytochrome P450 [Melanogaster broomeanus]
MDNTTIISVSLLAIGVVSYSIWKKPAKPLAAWPPGPRALPILGNLLDLPASEPWIAYKRLGEKYGDVVHVRLFTQDAIILNSFESAKALLEQRSPNYSSRPYLAASDMMDISWNTAFMPYSDVWRRHRRVFQQALHSDGAVIHQPMQMKRARELVKNIMGAPADYVQHLGTHSTSIIMSATYNYDAASFRDPLIEKIKVITELIAITISPESSAIMGSFPFLKYIPPWFPGATWQRAVFSVREMVAWWLEEPFQYVQDKLAQGTIAPCMVGDALSQIDDNNDDTAVVIQAIKAAAATSFAAASYTTDSVLQVFVLAMVLYPDVQKRAQDEIQAVVGLDRLPDFSDRPHLPYIEAVLRETLRWHPVVPLGIAHSNVIDDIYRGYFFPKGVTIIPNVWAMAHDEAKYPEPSVFNPGRFFDETGCLNEDAVSYVFGFGRRVCVGRHFADASLWSAIVNILAAFSFEAPVDETGEPIKILPQFTTEFTSHPAPFPLKITPRMWIKKLADLAKTDD